MLDELVVELGDEGGGLAAGFLSPLHADAAVGEGEMLLGAGDADVEEATFLVLGALGDRAEVGEIAFLQADQIHDGKFEAFGGVEGD